MKIKITSDSTIDLSKELLERFEIEVLPFIVTLGDKSYFDNQNLTTNQMFDSVEKTGEMPKTAARSPEDYNIFFKKFLDLGYEVVHIGVGSELSSGFSYANTGAKGLKGVYIADSCTLSSGSGLLAMYASTLAKSEKFSAKEICEIINKRAHNVQASFIIEKVKFLYKGGRCSMISMLGANLLRIKPCIQVVEGKNVVARKYVGAISHVVKKYLEETLKLYPTPDHTRAMITYSSATPEMLEVVKETLKKYGKFKEILYTNAGCVISSHCGPNTIGILYLNDGDKDHYHPFSPQKTPSNIKK